MIAHKDGKGDADMFGLMLNTILMNALGQAVVTNVTTEILTVDGNDICRVHVKPCGFPVDANVTEVDEKGQHLNRTVLYARINGPTVPMDDTEKQKQIAQRWQST